MGLNCTHDFKYSLDVRLIFDGFSFDVRLTVAGCSMDGHWMFDRFALGVR